MGNASTLAMTQRCMGAEVAAAVVKSLAGATQTMVEEATAKVKAMGRLGGLGSPQVAQVLGEGRGDHAALVVALMEPGGLGRIDYYEMLALMIMYGKTPARSKVRNMFDMFDLDHDGRLNSSETILMLRSLLSAIARSTGGVVPTTADIEDIWQHIVQAGYTDARDFLPYAQWVSFCARTREVHTLGKALDFNKGACRKALVSGARATLPGMATREDDPAIVAQRAAAAKKLQEKAVIAREQKRAAAAREGKSRFARSSVLKIKEVFDSIDKDGSGYVEEREWRRVTEDTPLAASDESSLWIEREREGKISIVEVLCEAYPFAGDGDVTKMLEWISEELPPSQQQQQQQQQQVAGRLATNRDLAVAERVEMAALFQMYDTEGNGEMTLGELSGAMAEVVGLTKEEVMPMFVQSARTEEDYITASEFADTLMEFVDGDASIQSLVRAV